MCTDAELVTDFNYLHFRYTIENGKWKTRGKDMQCVQEIGYNIWTKERIFRHHVSVFFPNFRFYLHCSSFYIPFLFPFVETSDIPSPMHMVTIKRQTLKIFIYSLQDFKCHNSFSLRLNVRNISIELLATQVYIFFELFDFAL